MSFLRPAMHTRVNWADHEEEGKIGPGKGAFKEKEALNSSLHPGKLKPLKQASLSRTKTVVSSPEADDVVEEEGRSESPRQQTATRPPRHTSSKYDFVKVRVWLGDNSDHYYVLSRFLVSRMLTVTKIPNHVAIKIALELKKLLTDNSLLDVSQSDLEANLFKLMERRGYGAEYINRYEMMTRFHHQRIPLIILVCGTACVGKSTIATQLAQRLNLPNVLQTDMVYELLRTATDAPLAATPVWAREFSSEEELITEFRRECRIVRKGLHGDLSKAMKDGKPVIIEGVHLDPSIYLMDEHNGTDTALQKEANSASVEATASAKKTASRNLEPETAELARAPGSSELGTTHALKALVDDGTGDHFSDKTRAGPSGRKESNTAEVNARSSVRPQAQAGNGDCSSSEENAPSSSAVMQNEPDPKRSDEAERIVPLKPPAKAIVVPIVLKMADVDHKTLLEEWIACRSVDGNETLEEKEALVKKLRILQEYLCSFESQGMKVVDISATTFPQTLDWLHSYLLQCIELGCASPSPGAGLRMLLVRHILIFEAFSKYGSLMESVYNQIHKLNIPPKTDFEILLSCLLVRAKHANPTYPSHPGRLGRVFCNSFTSFLLGSPRLAGALAILP